MHFSDYRWAAGQPGRTSCSSLLQTPSVDKDNVSLSHRMTSHGSLKKQFSKFRWINAYKREDIICVCIRVMCECPPSQLISYKVNNLYSLQCTHRLYKHRQTTSRNSLSFSLLKNTIPIVIGHYLKQQWFGLHFILLLRLVHYLYNTQPNCTLCLVNTNSWGSGC